MKKILAVVLVFGLLAPVGCATMSAIGTAIANVSQKICDFTTVEADQAQSAANFISTVAPIIGAVAGVVFTQAQAVAIFNTVYSAAQTGSCVLAADLTNAVNYFNAVAVQYQTLAQAKKMKAVSSIPDISLLRKRVGK